MSRIYVPAPRNKSKQELKLISPMQLHPCARQSCSPCLSFSLPCPRLLYQCSSLYCFEAGVLATTCEQEHALFDFLCQMYVPSMSLQQQNLIFIAKSYSCMHICLCAVHLSADSTKDSLLWFWSIVTQ